MRYNVRYHDVARRKVSWSAIIEDLSHQAIIQPILDKHVLRSNDINVSCDVPIGKIFASFHNVGTFTFTTVGHS